MHGYICRPVVLLLHLLSKNWPKKCSVIQSEFGALRFIRPWYNGSVGTGLVTSLSDDAEWPFEILWVGICYKKKRACPWAVVRCDNGVPITSSESSSPHLPHLKIFNEPDRERKKKKCSSNVLERYLKDLPFQQFCCVCVSKDNKDNALCKECTM